jgi:hypothetical protein
MRGESLILRFRARPAQRQTCVDVLCAFAPTFCWPARSAFCASHVTGADLSGAFLGSARLDQADLRGADFSAADITDATFRDAVADETTIWPAGFDAQEFGIRIADEASPVRSQRYSAGP